MRKKTLFVFLLSLLTVLWGCGGTQTAADTRIKVSILTGEGYSVHNNGQMIEPGDDVEFVMSVASGYGLDFVDYDGQYECRVEDGKLYLTLKAVEYPAQIRLHMTKQYGKVIYDPNGGEEDPVIKFYGESVHKRPNTENGTKLFRNPGHTLVSWNTEPDGSGIRIGLGSRVTIERELTLYAQWIRWSPAKDFLYTVTESETVTIDSYLGSDDTVVIPEQIDGYPVTAVGSGTFRGSPVRHAVIPHTVDRVEPGCFVDCPLETVTLFDNIGVISDSAFERCENLRTLYINAVEAPYGYAYEKESAYADKVDLLILAQGQKKMVFYAGCSAWYNLDGADASEAFGDQYTIINMAVNGTVNSSVQMQIMEHYLEAGDILIHTPELSSEQQLLADVRMDDGDVKLWCGLENNYDLFALVDLRTVEGAIDSLVNYLEQKTKESTYTSYYQDENRNQYMDPFGCVPFRREESKKELADEVRLNPACFTEEGLARLEEYYRQYQGKGVRVYLSCACVNMDAVPEAERENVEQMDRAVRDAFGTMEAVTVISKLEDYLFKNDDFYDTNYHLLSQPARENTALWIRDIRAQMIADGLWTGNQ